MTKIVLDTNVFISALFWKGPPYRAFEKTLTGKISHYTSPEILEETRRKLLEKFRLPPGKVNEFLETIVFTSKIVYPRHRVDVVLADPTDNKIIECAMEARASFIISGDKHLLDLKQYKGIELISPSKFLSQNPD